MGDMMGAAQMLEVYARKCEEYFFNIENKHMVWLREIEEEARRMFSSDFNAEPELMPKTPSQKRRRKKGRQSGVMEEKDRRLSRRSNNWSSSVRRRSMKLLDSEEAVPAPAVHDAPRATRQTRAQAQKVVSDNSENSSVKATECDLFCNMPRVRISNEDRQSANEVLAMGSSIENLLPPRSKDVSHHREVQPPCAFLTTQTSDDTCRSASKVKIASSTPEKAMVEIDRGLLKNDKLSDQNCLKHEANEEKDAEAHMVQEADVLPMDLSDVITEQRTADMASVLVTKGTPTGSKSDRRSVRRSLVGRSSRRHSLRDKYSLASKRESMTREAMRRSIRRSISKKAWESSASSCHSSTDGVEDDPIKARPEPIPSIAEIEERDSPQRSLRSRNARKIAITERNDAEQPRLPRATRQTAKNGEDKENVMEMEMGGQDLAKSTRRKSYKRAVESLYDVSYEQCADDAGQSPPRKKTPSPQCPANKVVRPPAANMRTFLHTVQKNQMLMSTPGSSTGKVNFIKSFIKRTTPLKSDIKGDFVEKERQRLEALRRKQEAEIQRKQKMEEEKRRKLEELKLRREERQRKVLQARERVEQIGEEKKRKIEQKFAQIDEKTEKVREDRLAEEKAKKKLTAKKMEDVEVRRRQDEEARRQKIQQMEEEERKHQEMMQKKREEEEQERSKKIAEAKKLAEQRQVELERERQREQQVAAEKELERKRDIERVLAEKERERQDKEKVLQQQREQEKIAREEATAQEKERVWRETEERKKKEQQEKLQKELEKERRAKEQDRPAKEEQERRAREEKAKEEQEKKTKENLAVSKALNVTLEVPKSPANQSYKMTPQNSKPKPLKICGDNYGMDLNSDDSTDDENEPRKPIPSWASGKLLNDILREQFYNPINVDRTFGGIESPKLEEMFYKSKPRYVKRTSSAVWHSPPLNNYRSVAMPYSMKKY